jgi:hypothetical protein
MSSTCQGSNKSLIVGTKLEAQVLKCLYSAWKCLTFQEGLPTADHVILGIDCNVVMCQFTKV